MSMKAQLEEEMDLHVGDIVTVTEIVDKDWFRYVTVSGFAIILGNDQLDTQMLYFTVRLL